jgi:ABC transport system ATP-binding/permease protein
MNILSLNKVSHAFGGPKLLNDASLHIESGDRICLLGRNGAGKSTLMHLINADMPPDAGEIIRNQEIQTAYVPQEFPKQWTGEIHIWLRDILAQHGIDAVQADLQIEQTLSQLDLNPHDKLETLSGGLKRRALLASALVQNPDLLLLDEPTNHLDIDAICWLESFLLRLRKSLIFISHDRSFTRALATRIVELDRGHIHDYRCNYETFLERRQEVLHAEEKDWARFDQKLAEEEIWIRKGIKARRTRNMGRVRDLQKMRSERQQRRERTGNVRLQLDEASKSGKIVIDTEQISYHYDDSGKLVIEDLDLRIIRGDRIGLIGPNGSGKTTLLKLLTGELQPSGGQLRHGTNLQITYFDQLRNQLDEERTVKQNIADDHDQVIINDKPRHIYGYLQDFLFSPDRARTPVKVLSGGEKNRLLLAKLFTQPANLLILDEPTNDLDMETLDLLEELLLDYNGTVLLVSHDRTFLNNVVTSSLIFDGKGKVDEIIGGYDDWLATQKQPEIKTKEKSVKKPRKTERARKLSFKEKRELEVLPGTIDTLETEQASIHEQMADPEIYKTDNGALISQMKERLEDVEIELETAYKRWEELDQIPD